MNDKLPLAIRATGFIYLILGLGLAVGGFWLLALGGSPYYALAGVGLAGSGVLLLRRQTLAILLLALVFVVSAGWALWEVGLDFWQLLPRLDLWALALAWAVTPWVTRHLLPQDKTLAGLRSVSGVVVLIAVLVCGYAATLDLHDMPGMRDWPQPAGATPTQDPSTWSAYGASSAGTRYSSASQLTPSNVSKLEMAWTYHTGDLKGVDDPKEIANEVTPLAANGKLYICTPHNVVIALDPDTGAELWRFDPHINRDAKSYQHMICRGVAYHDATAAADDGAFDASHPSAVAACPRRIYAPTADATVVAVNADTGKPCSFFGVNGAVDLKVGHGNVVRGFLNPTSPPLTSRHILVAAASVTDNDSTDEPSGVVKGYDIDTGKLIWNWDSGNPDETTPLPPGGTYVRNSPNMWSVASADEQLGLVYLPMGNQTPDIWGGNRNPNGEKFNSAIVALDLATGKVRWVYQTVHHDLWDMDVGGQPSLVDIKRPGGTIPALLASTKRGDIYVLDRRTGQPIVPAPERAVPTDAVAGDHSSPTQPFSELTFRPERVQERDMWGTSPVDQLICRIMFKRLHYEGIFTPPSEQGSLVYPGNYGVFDWGGLAVDPERQLVFANPNYMAFVSQLHRREKTNAKGGSGTEEGLQPMTGTPFAVDLHPLLSPFHVPCQAPPWGYVAAVDLANMKKVWMHKNGTIRDSAPLPIPMPLGVPSLGGPMVTAGGLAFMSATLDSYLRAYDVRSGELLWQARLPAGGQATPMSYLSTKSGRQYVVIMAGGHGSLGTKMGDSLIAYALPKATASSTSP
jgi:quinoprotein glucose dehydrogenase